MLSRTPTNGDTRIGAWTTIYKLGVTAAPGTPIAYGILALKAELNYLGAAGDTNLTTTIVGPRMVKAVKDFQAIHNLAADGQVGPHTARALFAKRVSALEATYHLRDHQACRVISLESAWDPGAVGVADPGDVGLAQIHLPAHPSITVEQAFTPSFAVNYTAEALHNAHVTLGDWDAAIAAWNVGGGGAAAWLAAGKPASLFELWFTDANGVELDLGARATRYVQLVSEQAC